MANLNSPEYRPLLQSPSPFAALALSSSADAGVAFSAREDLSLATVQVRKGQGAVFAQRVREQFQIELPREPCRAVAGDIALLGIGPGAWLATRDRSGNSFAAALVEAIGKVISVSDQSDGYAVLRVSGPKVREALCKLVPIDLHSRAFGIGQVAVTTAAHIGVTLWRLDDTAGDKGHWAVFEIAVPRSLAKSLSSAL